MKKIFVLISLVLSTVVYAQKDKAYKCHWHEQGIDDFISPTAEFEFSEKGKFTYLVSNDSENIYLDLRIADKAVQQQVMMTGINVWVNTDGKKHKKSGLKYPVVNQHRGAGGMPPAAGTAGMSGAPGNPHSSQSGAGNPKPDVSKMADSLKLIGLSGEEEKTIFAGEKGNYRGSLKIQNNQAMYYELILPIDNLKTIASDEEKKQFSIVLGISYEEPPTGGISKMSFATGSQIVGVPSPAGGGRGGGGGGRSGGSSMQGGGGMPPGGGSNSSAVQILIWLEPLALATGKI